MPARAGRVSGDPVSSGLRPLRARACQDTAGVPFRQRFPGSRRTSARIVAIVTVAAVLAVLASATAAPTPSRLPQIVANSEAMAPGTTLTISGWGFPDHFGERRS